MKFICSLITVNDIKRSCDFYEKFLGQKVLYDYGENVSFEGGFAIHLRPHFKQLIDDKDIITPANNNELYFEEDNLVLLEKSLREYGVKFVHPLREQPWRQRVIRFYDPDNNLIEVGESLEYLSWRLSEEGNSVEEIREIISMPKDFVVQAIEEYCQ